MADDVDSEVTINSRKPSIISRPQKCLPNPVSDEMRNAGIYLFNAIQTCGSPSKLLNCKRNGIVTTCISGKNLISWLCQYSRTTTRQTALGAWQVMVVEGVLLSTSETQGEIHDNSDLYYFHGDVCRTTAIRDEEADSATDDCSSDSDKLQNVVKMLLKRASDAFFRMVLQKPPLERTPKELEWVYNELLQIKSLSHLSPIVLRQLTHVLIYEAHQTAGEVLFNQGEEGTSWYIILRGSVDVDVHGKGVVCALQEGDDFGKLALVNNSPRAATLILRENNCHFLRVDKDDFNTILRDVEANKVRLKEHDRDVLILGRETTMSASSNLRYSILAGTSEKMLEHILMSLCKNFDSTNLSDSDETDIHDFILTFVIFMSASALASALKSHFVSDTEGSRTNNYLSKEDKLRQDVTSINKKRSVVAFLQKWFVLDKRDFFECSEIKDLVNEISGLITSDCKKYAILDIDANILKTLISDQSGDQRASHKRVSNRSRLSKSKASSKAPSCSQSLLERLPTRYANQPSIRVHLKDHSCHNLHLPLNASVSDILKTISNHLNAGPDELCLLEMRSDGEKVCFDPKEVSVTTALSVNGRLFVVRQQDISTLKPLPEQNLITEINSPDLLSSITWRDLSHHLAHYDCELFEKIQVKELVCVVFGRRNFNRSTANLDFFIVQFSRIQFWVVTQICLTQPIAKRVGLLKKFIKISQRLLDLNDICSFFAIMMGLNNSAVSRLSQTWDKLSTKSTKLFEELCYVLDPSRNHRALRQTMEKLEPPVIPFLAIILKDMTFTHEGNKTYEDGLVNFEKMQLIGKSLRCFLQCRSKSFLTHLLSKDHRSNSTASTGGGSSVATLAEMKMYVRQLECIDDQKVLTQLSQKLEPPVHKTI